MDFHYVKIDNVFGRVLIQTDFWKNVSSNFTTSWNLKRVKLIELKHSVSCCLHRQTLASLINFSWYRMEFGLNICCCFTCAERIMSCEYLLFMELEQLQWVQNVQHIQIQANWGSNKAKSQPNGVSQIWWQRNENPSNHI